MNTYPSPDKKNGFKSIYRVSDAQPNWAQTDPSQPDYIRNRDMAQEVRPIQVNGEEFLNNDVDSGALNLVAGRNVTLTTKNNSIIISAAGEGGGDIPLYDGDDVSIDLEDGILSLHGYEEAPKGSIPHKGQNNELEWLTLPEITQGDGNKVTTLTSADGSVTITKTTDTLASLVYDLSVKIPDNTTLIEALERKVDDYKIATDTELYGADLVNSWKSADGSYTPDYSAATSRLDTLSIVLEGFGGEGQPATVLEAINNIKVELPKATTEVLGGIKASESIAVDENGVATVAKVSTDVLVQGNKEFVLNGGGAHA